jgi:outer membrane protein OmpA-like peptidoglycan-associated protein
MNKKTFQIFLIGAALFLAGCGARLDPMFSPYIKAADRAIESARQRGAGKQDPAKFKALVKLRDDAEKIYMVCKYYEAIGMTKQVAQRADALKGLPKVAVKAPAAPKPVKAAVPKPLKLGLVRFDFDRYTVKSEFYPVLDQVVFSLKNIPGLRMVIEGHADSVGTLSYNKKLSQKRARAVVNYLVRKGVSRDRLSTVGWGEESPTTLNDTEKGRAMNRRVEFKLVGGAKGKSAGKN